MVDRRAVAFANAIRADLIDRVGADRTHVGVAANKMVGLHEDEGEGPIAVVCPRTPEQVAVILKVGRARHAPVLVRSRLPALDPTTLRGVIVLDARGLCSPPAIDITRRLVTVGAGVDVLLVDRAARRARLCLRGTPSQRSGDSIGSLLCLGEPGELGLGDGSLVEDLVGLTVVGGSGRIMRLGGSSMIGQVIWPCAGLPEPMAMLVGGEGKMAVVCDVTLRLRRVPHVAWSTMALSCSRDHVLQVLTAGRTAISRRLVDTILLEEREQSLHLNVRAATWRGVEDLSSVMTQTNRVFGQAGISLEAWQGEPGRVRLGHEEGLWPRPGETEVTFDLRFSWPDAIKVLDVSDALCAVASEVGPVRRSWALGANLVRLRHHIDGGRVDLHPVVKGFQHFIDAGAMPIRFGNAYRDAARARMSPSIKVLLTGVARAWDPDGVLGSNAGLL